MVGRTSLLIIKTSTHVHDLRVLKSSYAKCLMCSYSNTVKKIITVDVVMSPASNVWMIHHSVISCTWAIVVWHNLFIFKTVTLTLSEVITNDAIMSMWFHEWPITMWCRVYALLGDDSCWPWPLLRTHTWLRCKFSVLNTKFDLEIFDCLKLKYF